MAATHEVLRYLLARVPHSTQADYDEVAALIDQDEAGQAPAAKRDSTQADYDEVAALIDQDEAGQAPAAKRES